MKEQKFTKNIRISYLDSVKGIGILLIVLSHVAMGETGENPLRNGIMSFAVPLFFFVTGILLFIKDAYSEKTINTLLFDKMKALIYPYCVFTTVALPIYVVKTKVGGYSKTDLYT